MVSVSFYLCSIEVIYFKISNLVCTEGATKNILQRVKFFIQGY